MGRKPINKTRVDNPEIKQVWIKELTQLYLRNGLTRFTMDEIASKLNISKATLYKYFSSKDEILDEVVKLKIKEIEVFEKYLNDTQITFSERYFDVIKTASLMLAEMSERFLSDIHQKLPKLFKRMRQFQDRALYAAEKFYQHGIEAGIMNDINPRVLALTDKMFIQAVSNEKFLSEYDVTLKEALDGFFLMKSKGIFK
ncbi:MAG: TetR/AcrR family transcriptional regulator [Saprospiraceae bacterium]|nr:TetR/AcrR family transcriptional regulator [Saprospiraceae bacterium]